MNIDLAALAKAKARSKAIALSFNNITPLFFRSWRHKQFHTHSSSPFALSQKHPGTGQYFKFGLWFSMLGASNRDKMLRDGTRMVKGENIDPLVSMLMLRWSWKSDE